MPSTRGITMPNLPTAPWSRTLKSPVFRGWMKISGTSFSSNPDLRQEPSETDGAQGDGGSNENIHFRNNWGFSNGTINLSPNPCFSSPFPLPTRCFCTEHGTRNRLPGRVLQPCVNAQVSAYRPKCTRDRFLIKSSSTSALYAAAMFFEHKPVSTCRKCCCSCSPPSPCWFPPRDPTTGSSLKITRTLMSSAKVDFFFFFFYDRKNCF